MRRAAGWPRLSSGARQTITAWAMNAALIATARERRLQVPIAAAGFANYQRPPFSISPEDGVQLNVTLRERLREKFDIDLFAELEMAGLLGLRDDQQKKIRSILEAKNSAVRGAVPNSQQTAILYITQLAMLAGTTGPRMLGICAKQFAPLTTFGRKTESRAWSKEW